MEGAALLTQAVAAGWEVEAQFVEVERHCDRVLVLVGGRIRHDGPISAMTEPSECSFESALADLYERVPA